MGQLPYGQRQGCDQATIGLAIDQFNTVAREPNRHAKVVFGNITIALTRAAIGTRSQLASAGLHYSSPHVRLWTGQALLMVRALLR